MGEIEESHVRHEGSYPEMVIESYERTKERIGLRASELHHMMFGHPARGLT